MSSLNTNQPDWLSPEEYQMVVAPSLKVSAELAASRGDPKLFQDLPSMLCLMYLVTSLKNFYIDEWAVLSAMSSEESLGKSPEAACMMVFTEANVGKDELGPMMSSLSRAYTMVIEGGVNENADVDLSLAWECMKKSEHEQFFAHLEQAAKKFVIAIDAWERARHG
jgi:hypothetical protein